MFRIQHLGDAEIWDLAREHRVIPPGQSLRARADIKFPSIRRVNLRARADEPPPRHAIIFNWPTQRDSVMETALRLAAEATLKLVP